MLQQLHSQGKSFLRAQGKKCFHQDCQDLKLLREVSWLRDNLQETRAMEQPQQLLTQGSVHSFASSHPHAEASVHNKTVSYVLFIPK